MATTTVQNTTVQKALPFWKSRRFGNIIHNVIVYFFLVVLSIIFIFPLFWMLTTAFKVEYQIFIWPPQWIPNPIMWSNFKDAFSNPLLPFHLFFRNTMLLEVGIITGRLISCTMVAYGFARLNAPGKN